MNSRENLLRKLDVAAREKDLAKRGILIASVIAEALRSIGEDPVVVGGAAVEFYTDGRYATGDIDMLAEGGPELVRVMESLGFQKIGKDYADDRRKIYVEFPGRSLTGHEKANRIDVGGGYVRILSLEDLIVDRLNAFKFWKSEIDGTNALLLLENASLDESHLGIRAKEEDVWDILKSLRSLQEEIIRKKMPRKEATARLKSLIGKP